MNNPRDLSIYYPAARVLSVEGTREILDEIENGPRDTPKRRATLARAATWNDAIDRLFSSERKNAADGGGEK